MTTILSESRPNARKEHYCVWCGEQILKGEVYARQTLIFDGEFQSNCYHVECIEAAPYHDDWAGGFGIGEYKRGKPEYRDE